MFMKIYNNTCFVSRQKKILIVGRFQNVWKFRKLLNKNFVVKYMRARFCVKSFRLYFYALYVSDSEINSLSNNFMNTIDDNRIIQLTNELTIKFFIKYPDFVNYFEKSLSLAVYDYPYKDDAFLTCITLESIQLFHFNKIVKISFNFKDAVAAVALAKFKLFIIEDEFFIEDAVLYLFFNNVKINLQDYSELEIIFFIYDNLACDNNMFLYIESKTQNLELTKTFIVYFNTNDTYNNFYLNKILKQSKYINGI